MNITGNCLTGLFNEIGGHRIQRIPPTERRGRVHTSTVTVAVIDNAAQQNLPDCLKRSPEDFKLEWYSGSGAGGQHRNKHANSARITHLPTGLTKTAQTRSRENSQKLAMDSIICDLDNLAASSGHQITNTTRQQQIGSGMRGDKRRTYRFQDDQVKDHITGKSANCNKIMNGNFDLLW